MLETQNFTPAYVNGVDVRTDVRTIFQNQNFLDALITNFLAHGAALLPLRARESSAKNTNFLTENVNSSLIYDGSLKPTSTENEIYLK